MYCVYVYSIVHSVVPCVCMCVLLIWMLILIYACRLLQNPTHLVKSTSEARPESTDVTQLRKLLPIRRKSMKQHCKLRLMIPTYSFRDKIC